MGKISRIIITYDFFRPPPGMWSSTSPIPEMVYNLFYGPIHYGTNLDVIFYNENIYKKINHCKTDIDFWRTTYHAKPFDKLRQFIKEEFEDSIVVGYELSPLIKKALIEANIPYLDVILHPARFLPDLCFAFSSNSKEITSVLYENSLPERVLHTVASQQKARYVPNTRLKPVEEDTLLIIGQTDADKVLITNSGKIASLLDFTDTLDMLIRKHESCLFLPHPNSLEDAVYRYFAARKDVMISPIQPSPWLNSYVYLAHPAVSSIVGLNSSLLIEASYFGKQVTNLIDFEFDYCTRESSILSQNAVWPVYQKCFSRSFWHKVISCVTSLQIPLPQDDEPEPIPYIRLILRGGGSFDDAQSYTHCKRLGEIEDKLEYLYKEKKFRGNKQVS